MVDNPNLQDLAKQVAALETKIDKLAEHLKSALAYTQRIVTRPVW